MAEHYPQSQQHVETLQANEWHAQQEQQEGQLGSTPEPTLVEYSEPYAWPAGEDGMGPATSEARDGHQNDANMQHLARVALYPESMWR